MTIKKPKDEIILLWKAINKQQIFFFFFKTLFMQIQVAEVPPLNIWI